MKILLSSDNNYSPLLGITIESILENNSNEFSEITFYILDGGISKSNKNKINKIINKSKNINLKYIPYENIDKKLNIEIKATRALSAYAPLLSQTLLDDSIDKIIYMDCDGLVTNSLKEIWNTNITDYYFGAVLDIDSEYVNKFLNLDKATPHYNSGFLLINLKKWRNEDLQTKFLDFLIKNNGEVYHNDQGILNYVCKDKILKLHPKYNVLSPFFEIEYKKIIKLYESGNYYTEEIVKEAINDPVFIHLTKFLHGRPWFKNSLNHPLKNLFNYYANKTPFEENLIYINYDEKMIWKFFIWIYNYLPFTVLYILFKIFRFVKR